MGELLRIAFLANESVNAGFRGKLRWMLNRSQAVNALKPAVYTDRVLPMRDRRANKMQAVADAFSSLPNVVVLWNRAQMQTMLNC